METVKLSRVLERLEALSYPIDRDDAAAACADLTVEYADGRAALKDLVADLPSARFADAEELFSELQSGLPVEAVGEPGQSDGDA